MSDQTKSDSNPVVPPPDPPDETRTQNGVPEWLDGRDTPETAAPAPRTDSWPELIPLTKPSGKPPAAASPPRSASGPKWSEPDSWPEVPQPPLASPTEAPPETPHSTSGPFNVMEGVTVLRDDFGGLNRLRASFGGPTVDTPTEPTVPTLRPM